MSKDCTRCVRHNDIFLVNGLICSECRGIGKVDNASTARVPVTRIYNVPNNVNNVIKNVKKKCERCDKGLYTSGNNTLICGECRGEGEVMG